MMTNVLSTVRVRLTTKRVITILKLHAMMVVAVTQVKVAMGRRTERIVVCSLQGKRKRSVAKCKLALKGADLVRLQIVLRSVLV